MEKAENPLSRILSRWGLGETVEDIDPKEEQEILRSLGIAVIARWADMPRDVQKTIFEAAVTVGRTDKADVALFLHRHHRDTQLR